MYDLDSEEHWRVFIRLVALVWGCLTARKEMAIMTLVEEAREPRSEPARLCGKHAVLLWCVIVVLVHLPSLVLRILWIEDGTYKNDLAAQVILPGIQLYLMLLSMVVLTRAKPQLGAFDCKWFRSLRSDLVGLPVLLSGVLLAQAVVTAVYMVFGLSRYTEPELSAIPTGAFLAWLLARTTVLSPIVEEVFWRGYTQSTLTTAFGPWIAVPAQALLFGMFHSGGTAGILRASLLGLVFGIWCHRRKSFLPVIIVHSIHNTIVLGLQILY
jgi:membrane protease YdiL (CAAX protease family)